MVKKIVKHVVLDQELIDEVLRISAAQRESFSVVCRAALRAHVQKHKMGAMN